VSPNTLVLLFTGLIALMLVRSREVRIWQAVTFALFGFYLSWTPLETPIMSAVLWLVSGLTHAN